VSTIEPVLPIGNDGYCIFASKHDRVQKTLVPGIALVASLDHPDRSNQMIITGRLPVIGDFFQESFLWS